MTDAAPFNAGYHSDIKNGAENNFNFYARGEAPNYFKGNIDCDGLINGAFSLRMDTDDPAAFQTTYTTDDEGNQVEQQEYIGTTEDLLSIIKDLRARVAALEAAAGGGASTAKATTKEVSPRKRARNKDGTYKGDDPSTPDINEAWEGG